jgi:hypothetical protein
LFFLVLRNSLWYTHLGPNRGPGILEGIPIKAKITNNLLRRLKATGKGYDVYDTELPGFALRVSPEGKPTSYCVRYNSESGRKQRLGIGSVKVFTPTQARDLARAAIVESRKGEDPQAIKRKLRGGFTIGSFIEKEYGPKELIHKRSGKATQARLKSCFAALWCISSAKVGHIVRLVK